MLRFEQLSHNGKLVAVVAINKDGQEVSSLNPSGIATFQRHGRFTAAELRQIADELDRLNGQALRVDTDGIK
jgi:hypothetical protein